jgi:hypothetical protein
VTVFDPNSVPTFTEAELRDSRTAWERLERRRFAWFFARVAAVAVVAVAGGVWAIDSGVLSGGWLW